MPEEKPNPLKHGVILLIADQDELNLLAEVVEGVEVDALHVDEPYVAFMDEVLHVVPRAQLEVGHMFYGVKPRKFSSWYQTVKRKSKCSHIKKP